VKLVVHVFSVLTSFVVNLFFSVGQLLEHSVTFCVVFSV